MENIDEIDENTKNNISNCLEKYQALYMELRGEEHFENRRAIYVKLY